MGLTGAVALVVIFIGFPLLVYAAFRIVLSADRSDPEDGFDPDRRDES